MIECTEEYIYYTRGNKRERGRRKRSVKRMVCFVAVLFVISLIIFHINCNVFELVAEVCADYSESFAYNAVNKAINSSLTDEVKYSDLITVERNSSGEVVFLSAESYKMNALGRSVAAETEDLLKIELKKGIPIPIFAFSGIRFLSGAGATVKYSALTVLSVDCAFNGKFDSVGINQTMHSVFLSVKCKINVEFLHKKKTVEVSSDILLCEAVLVGKVPEIYLNNLS